MSILSNNIGLTKRTILVAFACLFFVEMRLSAYLISCIKFEPNIILLGDVHSHTPLHLDESRKQLQSIFHLLRSTTSTCFVFVEDYYKMIGRLLKRFDLDYMKHGLLPGLVDRIVSLDNPNVYTRSVERRLSLVDAICFFDISRQPPFPGDGSPEKVFQGRCLNPYTSTFAGLIAEIEKRRDELITRRSVVVGISKCKVFIDSMIRQINESLEKLTTILESNDIPHQISLLYMATDLRLKIFAEKKPHLMQDIIALRSDISLFMHDYPGRMDKATWKKRKDALMRKYTQILNQTSTIAPTQPGAISQEALFDLLECRFIKLGLLIFDSHAVLDILEYASRGMVVVIAGDLHVQNIRRHLQRFGFREISVVSMGDSQALRCDDIGF